MKNCNITNETDLTLFEVIDRLNKIIQNKVFSSSDSK